MNPLTLPWVTMPDSFVSENNTVEYFISSANGMDYKNDSQEDKRIHLEKEGWKQTWKLLQLLFIQWNMFQLLTSTSFCTRTKNTTKFLKWQVPCCYYLCSLSFHTSTKWCISLEIKWWQILFTLHHFSQYYLLLLYKLQYPHIQNRAPSVQMVCCGCVGRRMDVAEGK